MKQQTLFDLTDFDPPSSSADAATTTPSEAGDGVRLKGASVYIVDAHALIYQVFHAMPDFSNPKGEPVGAVHGFIRDIVDIIEKKKPDFLFVAFDASGDTFRHDLYPDYKLDREDMPDDLRPQIPKIEELLEALGIPVLRLAGYEADDILATVAELCEGVGARCSLVSPDKDCRQLISEQVRIYNIRKNSFFDADALQEVWGIRPEQVVDFQALVGDKVDNVPGIALIGPKNAQELLARYGDLESILDNAEHISGKKRKENLMNGRETALLCRELVRLDRNAPIEINWEAGKIGGLNPERLTELCSEHGFRRLSDRLANLTVVNAPVVWETDYRLIATENELDDLVATLQSQALISVDTETTHPQPRHAKLVGVSFCWEEGAACYVPIQSSDGKHLPAPLVLERLKPILEDDKIGKVGQNLKYDLIVLRQAGIELKGIKLDTMVADYLLAPGERNHNVDDLAKRYFNHQTTKYKDLAGSGRQQKRIDQVAVEKVAHYASEDADIPFRLSAILPQRLESLALTELYEGTEVPLIHVLAEMEWHGIRVDKERLAELSTRFGKRIYELSQDIYDTADADFNIDSPQQLAEVLFKKLKLPRIKATGKSGPSTDADVLKQLVDLHPLPAKILEYRHYAKLKSTYVDALTDLIHPETGRVHTSFKQDVAATGRLSSKDPNLQNIPIRTEVGREIRSAFVPDRPGWQLLAADYSQIELRILAHFSKDETLLAAFENDLDIHAQVASEVYGVELDDVTADMRRAAKAINFGVIYGQTAFGLARSLDIGKEEAAEFIDAYFRQYPGVEAFMERVLADCNRDGYVSTILGRRREVYGVRSEEKRESSRNRNLPERIAVNTVIQGSAADLIKLAMLKMHERLSLENWETRLLLQIHDELVFELPYDELETVRDAVQSTMSQVWDLDVPLKVDVKSGQDWADCH